MNGFFDALISLVTQCPTAKVAATMSGQDRASDTKWEIKVLIDPARPAKRKAPPKPSRLVYELEGSRGDLDDY